MSSAVEICLAQEAKLKDTQVKENAIRFNSVTNRFERWNGTEWERITTVPDPLDPDFTGLSVVSGKLCITYMVEA